jgi:hypothetical protein
VHSLNKNASHPSFASAAGGVMNLLVASNAGAQEFRVKGGTQQISVNLHREVGHDNVLFDHPVVSIKQVRLFKGLFTRNTNFMPPDVARRPATTIGLFLILSRDNRRHEIRVSCM